jgi:5-methylcytosine-specific restriction protein A
MTFTPSRPCKKSGCGALVGVGEGTYCPAHTTASRVERGHRDRLRGSAASRGYDADWQRARFAFLGQYPLCPGVLFPTELWTRELAQQFHTLREECREAGHLLPFSDVPKAGGMATVHPLAVLRAWLDEQRIYRVEPWDVSRPAVVVDHIIPHKGDHELMWAPWNWQPLTKRAHDRKTATEQGSAQRSAVSHQL